MLCTRQCNPWEDKKELCGHTVLGFTYIDNLRVKIGLGHKKFVLVLKIFVVVILHKSSMSAKNVCPDTKRQEIGLLHTIMWVERSRNRT